MIAENLQAVKQQIVTSQLNSKIGEDVLLVAVTKNHGVEAMREAIDAGVTAIGENRIQEAIGKYEILEREVAWHLIGHLQTNKAKQAVKYFDLIHSVDSEHLALALDKEAGKINKVQDILVQVNLAREDSKAGVYREELPQLLAAVAKLPNLRLCGLMCMAPFYDEAEKCRSLFREMREIFARLQEMPPKTANIKYLSMGMSHDYQIAIEEGANIVRVGTAIFGAREY